jgi:hypothetical protein
MDLIINSNEAQKRGLNTYEVLASLLIKDYDWERAVSELLLKGIIVEVGNGKFEVTQHWKDELENILACSVKSVPTNEQLTQFAEELRAIMPAGKMPGTAYYWKGNSREIVQKLQKFYSVYGTSYSQEEIKNALQRYVSSFNGNYRYMRLLKYFIFKKVDSGEEVSELATLLENQNEEQSTNWMDELR